MLAVIVPFLPHTADAGVLADFLTFLKPDLAYSAKNSLDSRSHNVQTMPLLTPAMNINPEPAHGGGAITIVDDSAVLPQEGPAGTVADIEKPKNATIIRYVVHDGDTVSSIAKLYDISPNTIRWANDLTPKSAIRPGQVLTILPVTSIRYTIQNGDTLASIARRYAADTGDIASFNGVDDTTLAAGDTILIPNGEAPALANTVPPTARAAVHTGVKRALSSGSEPAHNVGPRGTSEEVAYYIAPLSDYRETQGIHGYNGVDLGAPVGTPIMASADGDVIVARAGGWNGGYGNYVVVSHDNGSQTLYAHMSKVATYDGAHVVQGQVIGYVGNTGKSTGAHVHFEIRNGIRNPF